MMVYYYSDITMGFIQDFCTEDVLTSGSKQSGHSLNSVLN